MSDKQKRHPQTLTSADLGRRARASGVVGEIIAVEHQLDDDGRITTRIVIREGIHLGDTDTVEVW